MADWEECYRADQDEYRRNPLWRDNGICRNSVTEGGAVDPYYPWTCDLCYRSKKFCTLAASTAHFKERKHRNRIWERYFDDPPAAPRWPPSDEAVQARMASIESASPPPVWWEPPSASVLQGPPPTSNTRFESYSWRLISATTGGSAADAALAVNFARETTTTAVQASISCKPLPAYRWDTPGSRAPPPPPRVEFEDLTGHLRAPPAYKAPPPSSRARAVSVPRPDLLCVPTPAVIGMSAPASPPRSALWSSWVGMSGVLAKPFPPTQAASCPVGAGGPPQSPPWTSPKPPPPMPPPFRASNGAPSAVRVPATRWWDAPADVPSHSAASARAVVSCGEGAREGEEGQEPSK